MKEEVKKPEQRIAVLEKKVEWLIRQLQKHLESDCEMAAEFQKIICSLYREDNKQ